MKPRLAAALLELARFKTALAYCTMYNVLCLLAGKKPSHHNINVPGKHI